MSERAGPLCFEDGCESECLRQVKYFQKEILERAKSNYIIVIPCNLLAEYSVFSRERLFYSPVLETEPPRHVT